jgi:hypothetical protein
MFENCEGTKEAICIKIEFTLSSSSSSSYTDDYQVQFVCWIINCVVACLHGCLLFYMIHNIVHYTRSLGCIVSPTNSTNMLFIVLFVFDTGFFRSAFV